MTEPAGDPPQRPDGDHTVDQTATSLEDSLESLKERRAGADTGPVNDAIGGRPRLNWNPVTDGGVDPHVESSVKAGFRFDLGGALAKLGGDPPQAEPTPPPAARLLDDPSTDANTNTGADTGADTDTAIEVGVAPDPGLDVGSLLSRLMGDAGDGAGAGAGTDHGHPADTTSVTPAPGADLTLPTRRPPHADSAIAGSPSTDSPPAAELPTRTPSPVAAPEPVNDPLPRRSAAHQEAFPETAPPVARRSVFEESSTAHAPTPTVAPAAAVAPVAAGPAVVTQPTVAVASAPTLPEAGAAPTLPTLPAAPTLPSLPTLPAAPPVQHPAYSPPIDSAPSAPDLHALRSAQLRASRQQKRGGKLFARTMLVLVLVGGLIAAALVFGRDYLFPIEWDASLTPIVDDIQQTRGVDFEHTVELVRQPSADYALTVAPLIAGEDWVSHTAEWRALGLASGEPTPSSLASVLAAGRLAVYDPAADRIYLDADADPLAAQVDLRLAAEAAYAAQFADPSAPVDEPAMGFTGTAPLRVIAEQAVGRYLAQRAATATPSIPVPGATLPEPSQPAQPAPPAGGLPLPIEYQLGAIDSLGEALLIASGVDPTTATFAAGYPAELGTLLDDGPRQAPTSILLVGERALADPVALGVDDWSLVWGARLPEASASQLTRIVSADSYRPIDRAGVTCVVGVFETDTPADAAIVLSAMTSWAAASPPASQAVASSTSDRTVQLVSCDPGAEAATPPPSGVADSLIDRQLRRLGA